MKALIRRTVQICHEYKHSHLPGALSALQVMAPIFASMTKEDVFVLSKGHAAAALYACLEAKGYHPDLAKTHPERDPENGVTCTTGSLGHGLPMAAGIAFARILQDKPCHTHVLIGDGECLEGTCWEGLHIAEQLGVHGLQVHIDGNGCGALGRLPLSLPPTRLARMWPEWVKYHETTKGHGVSFLEGTKDHKRVLTDAEYEQAMGELK